MGIEGNVDHYYDDDIVQTIAEEFTDRISTLVIIGDVIRSLGGLLGKRTLFVWHQIIEKILDVIKIDK